MKSSISKSFYAFFVLVSGCIAFSTAVRADDDFIVCPAVYACAEDGSVSPPFDKGPCGERFAKSCASLKHNEHNEDIAACSESNDALESSLKKAKKELESVKKKNRSLRRQLRGK